MTEKSRKYLKEIGKLQERLEEAEQLIDAIKSGEVDAFAIRKKNDSEVYTLQSGDYAYRVLVEELSEGALNVTEEGLIVYTNPCFCKMAGVPYDKVIGSSVIEFICPDYRDAFQVLFAAAKIGKSKGEICLVAGPSRIPVYISFTSLQPKLPTIGMIIADLGEKKQFERALSEKNRELIKANQELEKMNKELQSFAYISSHDLQEPLRKIQTFSSSIIEKELDKLSDTGKDHFRRMQAAAKRMQTLINDLLAYSRTNVAEYRFEKTDLNQIVANITDELKEEIEVKKAVISTAGLGDVFVIPFQFRQLLYNLVSNSLKFSRPGVPPRISIEAVDDISDDLTGKETNFCHLTVADNGIGFEPEYSEKIFEVFQQLHGKNEYGGTGIGLSIVKKIVENHEGAIKAKGVLNEGAVFDIFFPSAQLGKRKWETQT